MSATLVNGMVVESVSICSLPPQISVTRRYWLCSNLVGPSPSTFDAAGVIDGVLGPIFKTLLTSAATYRGTQIRRASGIPPFESWDVSTAAAGVGLGGAIPLPKQACGLITMTGAFIGRRFQGRVYLPFPSAADDAGTGQPNVGYMIAAAAMGTALSTPHTVPGGGGTIELNPLNWKATDPIPRLLVGFIPRPAWATQKRRGDFGRTNFTPF